LGDTGAEVALSRRELGAVDGLGHVLCNDIIQDSNQKQEQKRITNLLPIRSKAKNTYGIRCFDWMRNLVPESLLNRDRKLRRENELAFGRHHQWLDRIL
jgi:hypothetical protein